MGSALTGAAVLDCEAGGAPEPVPTTAFDPHHAIATATRTLEIALPQRFMILLLLVNRGVFIASETLQGAGRFPTVRRATCGTPRDSHPSTPHLGDNATEGLVVLAFRPDDERTNTPPILPEIISVEHAAATRNHVAFFDTFAAMGGADHMEPWTEADPKVAYKDRVHFTDIGYQRWADALGNALLENYARWRSEQKLPAVKAVVPAPIVPSDALLPGPVAP